MATTMRFTKTICAYPTVVWTDADPTTIKTIVPANATYSQRVTGLVVTSTSTAAQIAKLYINDGSQGALDMCIGWVTIPITAGNLAATTPVGIMASLPSSFRELDANGVSILNLPAGAFLRMNFDAVSAGKALSLWPKAELYD